MSWALDVVPALRRLALALTAAGVDATLDRKSLQVPGAWVRPDRAGTFTLSGAGTVRASVLLVVAQQGDEESLEDLVELLDKALDVIDPEEDVETDVILPHNNNALPAFRLVVDLDLEE